MLNFCERVKTPNLAALGSLTSDAPLGISPEWLIWQLRLSPHVASACVARCTTQPGLQNSARGETRLACSSDSLPPCSVGDAPMSLLAVAALAGSPRRAFALCSSPEKIRREGGARVVEKRHVGRVPWEIGDGSNGAAPKTRDWVWWSGRGD